MELFNKTDPLFNRDEVLTDIEKRIAASNLETFAEVSEDERKAFVLNFGEECLADGGHDLYMFEAQLRSMDEGVTRKIICKTCSREFDTDRL